MLLLLFQMAVKRKGKRKPLLKLFERCRFVLFLCRINLSCAACQGCVSTEKKRLFWILFSAFRSTLSLEMKRVFFPNSIAK